MKKLQVMALFMLFSTGVAFAQAISIESIEHNANLPAIVDVIVNPIEGSGLPSWWSEYNELTIAAVQQTERDIIESAAAAGNQFLQIEITDNSESANRIALRMAEPVKIPGITKTLSLWFYVNDSDSIGLRGIITDVEGVEYKIWFVKSCTLGWKKYTVSIHPRIIQVIYPNYPNAGIYFSGIEIVLDRAEEKALTFGFDAVSAVVDVYSIRNRNLDAVSNTW